MFSIILNFKEAMVYKHSLEKRLQADKEQYEHYKKFSDSTHREERTRFMEDYEYHVKCLEELTKKVAEEFNRGRKAKREGLKHEKINNDI